MTTGTNAAGMSYAIAETVAGAGTPSVSAALTLFATDWNTIVVDSYGILNTAVNAQILAYNGNVNNKNGQWDPMVFRPAIYLAGSVTDSTTVSADTAITIAMAKEMSIACCPTPLSLGLPMEGAANYAVAFGNVSNTTPNIDIQGGPLQDMPGILPGGANPSQSSNYTLRNTLLGDGMSTVIYNNGLYYPQDFITTYAPVGETPPAFRYCRNLCIDMNVEYKFDNLKTALISNKQIAADADTVNVPNVVKPKDIKSALFTFSTDLVSSGFTTNAAAMQKSVSVIINPSNADRFDISFTYDRSGVTRVISNVATVNP